jgi:hypothetical protein
MKQILANKKQTVYDIAVQEYGNVEAVFQIISDNPTIENETTVELEIGVEFDLAGYIKENSIINISENLDIERPLISRELTTVIS